MAYNVLKGKVQFINSATGSIESMVDDYSNQTIGGQKTFSQPTTITNLNSTNITSASGSFGNLTISSSVHHTPLLVLDKAEASSSFIEFRKNGTKHAEIYANEFETLFVKTNAVSYPIFFRQAGHTPMKFQDSEVTFQSFPVNISQSLAVTGATFVSTLTAASNISASAFYGAGTGLTGIAASSLTLGQSMQNVGGGLDVKLSSSSGIESTVTGLRVNPSLAVAKTPPADADTFLISDSDSGNETKKITYQNLANAITSGISTLSTNGNNGAIQIKNNTTLLGPNELNFNTSTNTLTVIGNITGSTKIVSPSIHGTNFFGNGSNLNGVSTLSYISTTSSLNVLSTHSLLGINSRASAITASFASANSYQAGQTFTFKDIEGSGSTNHIVIKPSGSQKIDGNSLVKIKADYGAVSIATDGVSNFYIVSTS